ncbi:hypothetical protein RHS03_00872, partial [Rhizoctonia solani]
MGTLLAAGIRRVALDPLWDSLGLGFLQSIRPGVRLVLQHVLILWSIHTYYRLSSITLPPTSIINMASRSTRRSNQPAPPQHGVQQMCHCSMWRYPHHPHRSATTSNAQPRRSAEWEHDPSSPDFLPYAPLSSDSGPSSYHSRSRSHASYYTPRVETLHYNPNYYHGQTYSEVEFDPEIDGQDPAPDSPHSDRSRTDSHRSEQLYAANLDDGAADYVLEPPIPRAFLPSRLRDDISGRFWNAEGDSTDASGILYPAPFEVKLSKEAFYYPSAQSGRFMNRRGEYWAGGEA